MRNEIAEWMLSQAAPPEQAKAVLGDLLEAQPGWVEFSFAVVRAAVSIAAHQPRQVFKGILSFAYEGAGYLSVIWVVAEKPRHVFLLAGAVVGVWLVVGRRLGGLAGKSSVLAPAIFWIWYLKHVARLSTWIVLLSMLPCIPYRLWTLKRNQQSNAGREHDRPAAW